MSTPEVKITAEIQPNPDVCKFTVDRLIFPGTITFTEAAEATGSPLAEKLLALDGVGAVTFSTRDVTVTKASGGEWLPLAKQVGATIRGQIQSGEPLFGEKHLPQFESVSAAELKQRVQRVIDEMVNPGVAAHGGFVELLDIKDHTAFIRMGGGCQGCGMADVTLKQGVSRLIQDEVPQIVEILDATDHAGGQNPFYAPAK